MSDSPPAAHEFKPHRIPLEIAVLGGGFAGVFCGRELCKQLKKIGKDQETAAIVSDQNYMVFQPMLAEVAGASLSPRHVVNPIRTLCQGINVFKGQVESVDLAKQEVRVNTGDFSAGVILEYNHLVLALGAEVDLSRVPGMPEHALLMRNVGDAMILRATIISRIEEANAESRETVRRRLLTFVVVGGGFSGVETAGEILDMLHSVSKYYKRISKEEIRVVLIHSRDRILHTLSLSLGLYAARKLQKRGLEIGLNERVRAVTATKVYLKSGGVIETATVVSTVGNAPNRVIRDLCEKEELEHNNYWIKTDEHMRVLGQKNVWAAGDCAAIPMSSSYGSTTCPQTAQFAMRQGIKLADNIVRHIKGDTPKPFTFTGMGELASIGHRTAVANIMGLQFSGIIAWFLWRSIYLSKLPGLDRKLRVMIDWTLDLFFPRDINLLNPRYSRVFRHVHLEPTDKLFNRSEPAFSLYVVKTGCIELKDSEGQTVRTVQSGDFFGERALVYGGGYLYDAIATEQTELMSMSGEAILPFLEASERLRRVLSKTTTQHSAEAELAAIERKMDPAMLRKSVAEVMITDMATLQADQTVHDALQLFQKRRYSTYPLLTPDGKLVGALSREDFFDYMKREDVSVKTTLERIVQYPLPIVPQTASVGEALEQIIRSGRYKCLIIDHDNRLKGIITLLDLIGDAGAFQDEAKPTPEE